MRRLGLSGGCIFIALALGSPTASLPAETGPAPIDEAQLAGRSEASFPQASEDFFHDMDNGVQLTPDASPRAATCGSSGPAETTASGTR